MGDIHFSRCYNFFIFSDKAFLDLEEGESMFKKILVPLDGSKLAEKILPRVEKWVGRGQSEVHFIRVVVSYRIDPKEEKEEREKLMREAWNYLEKVVSRLRKKRMRAYATVVYGKDAVQICDFARKNKFDLIAMATHGRSGISRWALGSVADKVLNCSVVPVMLIRVL
jgi:nucleotide-binding universal stress UspA family protein